MLHIALNFGSVIRFMANETPNGVLGIEVESVLGVVNGTIRIGCPGVALGGGAISVIVVAGW